MAGRRRVLIFGYLPPPVFGPSMTYQALLRSSFATRYDVKFINLSVVAEIKDLGRFQWAKVWRSVRLLVTSGYWLARHRWDCVLYPPGFSRSALWKDWLLLGCAQARGLPTVAMALGTGMTAFRQKLTDRQRQMWDGLWQRARAVTVLADCLRSDFVGLVEPERVWPVALGIEPPPELPPRQTDPGAPRLVYVGALNEAKGFLNLLRAFQLVRQRTRGVTLEVAGQWGNEADRQLGMELVAKLDEPASVKFWGVLTGLPKWELLRSCDGLVFPPLPDREAFGLVMLEALCAGLPVVATAGGARSEVLREGVNGWLIPAGDIPALADALLKLIENPDRRLAMGAANEQYFATQFTHEQFGLRLTTLLDRLLFKPKP